MSTGTGMGIPQGSQRWTQPSLQPVPQQRIVEKLDEYMSRRDYAGAERHLLYWLAEAQAACDERGELMLRNELVGHFRKTGNADQAFLHAEQALQLVARLGFADTVSAGTTYTNVATAYNAFGRNQESLQLFERAAAAYESNANTDPRLLGGLYNNMALVCASLGGFGQADGLYAKALATMANVEHGQLEQAITYLNMADAAVAKDAAAQANAKELGGDNGSEVEAKPDASDEAPVMSEACEREVERLLDQALELLDTPSVPRDGYYAFVCEKCAPTFGHYGYFLAESDLQKRAQTIYER